MRFKRLTLMLLAIFALPVFIYGQVKESMEHIKSALGDYKDHYFQQKVYVHTDRQVYSPGEVIWMKAYLLNEETHAFDNKSTNLYVDLVDFRGTIIHNRVLRLHNGTAKGDLAISDTLQNGEYRLRAYTQWMHNFSSDYWYSRPIEINNKSHVYYQFADRREAKKKVRRVDRLDVQFFPEGGTFVAGLPNNIAIKAVNYQGEGVNFEGGIGERFEEQVVKVKSKHAGMTRVTLTPKAGTKYFADLEFANGRDKKYKLPKVADQGAVMHVNPAPEKEHFTIKLYSNIPLHGNANRKKFIISGMVRNKIYHVNSYTLEEGEAKARISKSKFPAGIVHFSLFDYKGEPMAERLVFNPTGAELSVDGPQVKKFAGNDSARVDFQLKHANPSQKNSFSMAVIGKEEAEQVWAEDIETYLLLTSDLKGRVENPEWYFTGDYTEKARYLDNLLLTQGWRRFDWQKVLNDKVEEPEFDVQNKLEVAGKVTREIVKVPYENANVELVVLNKYNDTYQTRTNEEGRFHFEGLEYQDSVEMLLKARKPNGSKYVLVWLDDTDLQEPEYRIMEPDSFLADYEMRKSRGFTGNKDESPGSLHGDPDHMIDIKPYHNSGYTNVFDILKGRVPGLNNGIIRGINSFYLSSAPLYLIDGVPVDAGAVSAVPVNDIDHVEILKNPTNTAIYGVRGSNGVIALYTMQGHHVSHGKREFTMLGFHTPTEFYRPAFENARKKDYPLKLKTLYWQPDLSTDSSGHVETTFPIKHIKGNYIIDIQGVADGKGVSLTRSLKVEK